MVTTKRPKVSSFVSTSSKARETKQNLVQAHERISELEEELKTSEKQLKKLVDESCVSQAKVEISEIQRRPYTSRRERDTNDFADLVSSIKTFGFLGSIWVQRLPGQKLRLIAGETRLDAAIEAGLTQIKVDIAEVDDITAVKLSRVENTRRKNLNALDDTEELLYLLSLVLQKSKKETIRCLYRYKNASEGKTKIDETVKSKIESTFLETAPELSIKTFVSSRLPLLELPSEVLEAYNTGQIEYTKAIFLSRITNTKLRSQLLEETINHNLSLAALKQKVKPADGDKAIDTITSLNSRLDTFSSKQISKLTKRQKSQVRKSVQELERKIQDILEQLG